MEQAAATVASGKESPALFEIEKAKKEGANLLLPSTKLEGLSDFHAPVVDSVYLSPNPDDGDVYPEKLTEDNNKFRIAAQGLRKLSVCAGIIWHPTECRRVDNRQDRDYVAFQAVGGIRKADGTPVFWKGEYDLDFEVIEEELREQYYQKCKNWRKTDKEKQAYIESSVRRDLIFKRKHKIKLAETGAMNRVIRAILGLKSSYTAAELQKPFVMVRIVLRPDYNDKDVREKMLNAAIKSMTGVYGSDAAPQMDIPPIDVPDNDFHDVNEENGEPEEPAAPEDDAPPSDQEVFEGYSKDEQISVLKALAEKKGYDLKNLKKNLDSFTPKNRLDFWKALNEMPDIKPAKSQHGPGDDIPF